METRRSLLLALQKPRRCSRLGNHLMKNNSHIGDVHHRPSVGRHTEGPPTWGESSARGQSPIVVPAIRLAGERRESSRPDRDDSSETRTGSGWERLSPAVGRAHAGADLSRVNRAGHPVACRATGEAARLLGIVGWISVSPTSDDGRAA